MLTEGYSCSGADECRSLTVSRNISLINLPSPCTNLLHKARYYLSLLLLLMPAFLPCLFSSCTVHCSLSDDFCTERDVFRSSPSCRIPLLEEELRENHLPWFSRITDLRSGAVLFGPLCLIAVEGEQLCVDLPGSFPNCGNGHRYHV